MKSVFSSLLPVSLCACGYLYATSEITLAQVTSDNTVNTTVNQNGNVAEITNGTTRGDNLFHSFKEFSVSSGNEAFFNNATNISNIFSRVTGGKVSNIDGLIRANGNASLFLINPQGIIFGEGASLDLGGSFYGSSASSILFEEGEFSATDLDNPPLLTVNAPVGLSFRDNPGEIKLQNADLSINPGQNFTLLGGKINLTAGKISTPGGVINLGGLSTAGTVNLDGDNNFSFPDDVAKADILLSNNSEVDTTADGGGSITVNVNDLKLTGESLMLAGIGEDLGSENAVAGTIEINSTSISADSDSQIRADNLGIGKGGTINITTDTLDFVEGSAIVVSSFGKGDAGTVNVTAKDISIDNEWSGIYSNIGLTRIATDEPDVEGVVGNAGTINIDTDTLSLTNGARILSTSIAQGNGGAININATGEVSYIGQGVTPVPAFGGGPAISGSFSQVQQGGVGNSGRVTIKADSLTLIDKGAVLVDNSGEGGDAGDINIEIKNDIFLDKIGLILAQVQEGAKGNGGDINITAGSFEAKGGSFILADTKGEGNAGNITFDIQETLSLDDGTLILTEVQQDAMGNAGNIDVIANSVVINNSSGIASQTKGKGDAGDITITATDIISLDSGEIKTLVESNATGNGGDISLTSGELNLSNGSNVIADTQGISSNEGDISLAGNIDIDVSNSINLEQNSSISARAFNNANGGNVNIDSEFVIASIDESEENGNDITASATAGNGGNININAQSLFGIKERKAVEGNRTNDIDASSKFGLDGNVSIFTPVDRIKSINELPSNVVEPQETTAQACAAQQGTAAASILNITGKGGMPPEPTSPLNAENILINERSVATSVNSEPKVNNPLSTPQAIDMLRGPSAIATAQGNIIPARGIVKTAEGRIILSSYATDNQGNRLPQASPNCS